MAHTFAMTTADTMAIPPNNASLAVQIKPCSCGELWRLVLRAGGKSRSPETKHTDREYEYMKFSQL